MVEQFSCKGYLVHGLRNNSVTVPKIDNHSGANNNQGNQVPSFILLAK